MERRRWLPALLALVALLAAKGAEGAFGLRTRPLRPTTTTTTTTITAATGRPAAHDDGDDDGLLLADAGGGGKGDAADGSEDKKSLAQQVSEGKYGLIQDLLPKKVKRPGIVSYAANPEVPADTADNLGGLDHEDIWLAEDHVLVLAGGGFRDKGGGGLVPQWPAIDDYHAPRRQVKIPARPAVPPPFPVQLRDGERPQFVPGGHQGNYPPGSGPPRGPWAPVNGSLPAGPPPPPPPPPHRPPGWGNASDPLDEDDPALYYPPPYDFYYASDNTTEVPPGPLVPGIVLPPPPDFFSPLEDATSTPGPEYLPVAKPSTTSTTTPRPRIAVHKESRGKAATRTKGRNNVRVRYPGQTDTPLYYYDGPGISQQVVVTSSSPEHLPDPYERQRPSGFQKGPPAKEQVIYVFTSPDDDEDDFQGNRVSTAAPPARDVPTPPRLEDFHSGQGFAPGANASPPPTNYFLEDYYANSYVASGNHGHQNNHPTAYYSLSAPQRGNGTRDGRLNDGAAPTRSFAGHAVQTHHGLRPNAQQAVAHNLPARLPQIYHGETATYSPRQRQPATTVTPAPRQRGHGSKFPHGVSVITVKPAVLYASSINGHREEADTAFSPVIPRPDTSQIDGGHPGVAIVTAKPYVYSIPSGEANRDHQAIAFGYATTRQPEPAFSGGPSTPGPFTSRIRFPQEVSQHHTPDYVLVTPSPPIDDPRQSPAVRYQEYFEAKGHGAASHLGGFSAYDGLLAHSTAKPLHVQVHGDSGRLPPRESFPEGGRGYVLGSQAEPHRGNSHYLVASYVRRPQQSYERPHQQQVFAHGAAHLGYPSPTSAPFTPSPFAPSVGTTANPLPAYYTTHDVSLFDDATKNHFSVFGQKLSEGPTTPLPFGGDRSGEAYPGPVESSTRAGSLEDDVRVNFREPLPPVNPDSELIVPRPQPPKHRSGAVVSYQLPGVDGKGSAGASHYYFLTPQPSQGSHSRSPQLDTYYPQQQGRRPSFGDYWTDYASG